MKKCYSKKAWMKHKMKKMMLSYEKTIPIDKTQDEKIVALTKHKMKMIMLSYEKIKMTLKNKQQEERKTQ